MYALVPACKSTLCRSWVGVWVASGGRPPRETARWMAILTQYFFSFLFLDVLKDARLMYCSLWSGEVGVGKLQLDCSQGEKMS